MSVILQIFRFRRLDGLLLQKRERKADPNPKGGTGTEMVLRKAKIIAEEEEEEEED